jgi:hypothetical protein
LPNLSYRIFETLHHALSAVEPCSLHPDKLHWHQLHNVAAAIPQPPQADGDQSVVKVKVGEVSADLTHHVAQMVTLALCRDRLSVVVAESVLAPILGSERKLCCSLDEARGTERLCQCPELVQLVDAPGRRSVAGRS